jgi:hypothetical protein
MHSRTPKVKVKAKIPSKVTSKMRLRLTTWTKIPQLPSKLKIRFPKLKKKYKRQKLKFFTLTMLMMMSLWNPFPRPSTTTR